MIPCLRILEILLAIFEGVSEDNKDLVSLALTCRAFCDPALSILWRTQHSLMPLVFCFPQDLLVDTIEDGDNNPRLGPVLKFARSPYVQDWKRPLFYAKYIRVLAESCSQTRIGWKFYSLHPSAPKVLLDSCPTPPLLPNLREFKYSSHFDHTAYATTDFTLYLESLFKLTRPGMLRSLSFAIPGIGSSDSDFRGWSLRSSFVEQFTAIESLKITTNPSQCTECFLASASLPNLKTLRLRSLFHGLDSNLEPLTIRSFENLLDPFPAILELGIDGFPVTCILVVLDAIRSPRLSSVRIHPLIAGNDEVLLLCGVLTSRPTWRESVRSIELGGSTSLKLRSFEQLLSLKELRSVRLSSMGSRSAIDDESSDVFASMARAWPMLQNFTYCICPSRGVDSAVLVPLRTLIPFSKYCPNLTYLALPLAIDQIPPLSSIRDVVSHDRDLTTKTEPVLVINATASSFVPAGDPEVVSHRLSEFLLELFPRIQVELSCKDPYLPSKVDETWENVSDIINTQLGRPLAERILPFRCGTNSIMGLGVEI